MRQRQDATRQSLLRRSTWLAAWTITLAACSDSSESGDPAAAAPLDPGDPLDGPTSNQDPETPTDGAGNPNPAVDPSIPDAEPGTTPGEPSEPIASGGAPGDDGAPDTEPGTGGESNSAPTTGGEGGSGGDGPSAGGASEPATGGQPNMEPPVELEPFSFFVTSYSAMARLSGSEAGFGGDLRYGEADGLSGADKICAEIAEDSMPGASAKEWRAFLSTSAVDAIDRVGEGPWYDRLGRLVAMNPAALQSPRPEGAAIEIINDLPNEFGVPNKDPDGTGDVDNHHVLTGSDDQGRLWSPNSTDATCNDWTSSEPDGAPRVGLTWPGNQRRQNWISQMAEAGCAPGVNFMFGGMNGEPTVGSGGGYGAFYCFALTP